MRLSLKFLVFNSAFLTFGTILIVVILFFAGIPILDLIELRTYDLRFFSRGQVPPSPAVMLAVIDEKSLNTEGRWPWPRSTFAALVDRLSDDGATVIGFDIGFLEPDENSQLALLDQVAQKVEALGIQHPALADFIKESKKHADNDLALAQAIQRSSAAVVLGYFFHMSETDLSDRLAQRDLDRQFQYISASKYPLIAYKGQSRNNTSFLKAYAPESNLPMLADAAASAGYFTLKSDQDGVIRWMPLMLQGGEDLFPPLAISVVWRYLGKPPLTVQVERYGVEGIEMGQRFIPTDENGRMLINYLGPPMTFPYVSISDILSGKMAPGTFTNKIVLVGATAMGVYDVKSTPLSTVYPGVEVHATVIDNILTQNFLTKPTWSRIYDLLAIIALGALVGVVLPRMGAWRALLLVLGLGMGYIGIVHWLFVKLHMWLNVVYPLAVLAMNYTVLTVYSYVTEERERQKIKGAFEHYVSPEVIDEITKYPEKLNLGGERRILTVLFSDVQNFTAIAESMDSSKLVELLNEYLTAMTDIVLQYLGTLDKYIGDAIMAFYGAPVRHEDHAFMACYTALGMVEELKKLRAAWAVRKLPPISMRIGIHTGDVTVGNMGSAKRFDYTVMGDTVNLASRLEGLNKAYGTAILLTENTACLVEKSFLLREIDMVRVVGRKRPVRIYALLAAAGRSIPEEQEEAFKSYAAGLEAYRQQCWDSALELFTRSLTLWPEDSPSRTMVERCQIYQQAPPPEEWDGVFEHTHK